MAHNKIRNKLSSAFFILCALILISWSIYHVWFYNNMKSTHQTYITQISNTIISELQQTFLEMEYAAISLSSESTVQDLMYEENSIETYKKVSHVTTTLNTLYPNDYLVNDILLYTKDSQYYRLRGEIGNTSARRLGIIIHSDKDISYCVTTLGGIEYLAYITSVFQSNTYSGNIVFLIQLDKLEEQFQERNLIGSIDILLTADDQIITSNMDTTLLPELNLYLQSTYSYLMEDIGYTPFQLIVADNGDFLHSSLSLFLIITTISILLLLTLLVLFSKNLYQKFINPMLHVIENTKQIQVGNYFQLISLTGAPEVDELINQINIMIQTVEERSVSFYKMQFRVKDAEIQHQKATISFLTKQINTHFMLNSLNVIKRLNDLGQYKHAQEVCNGLSYILRYANGSEPYVDALDEIQVLEKYVRIMHIRYHECFEWEFETEEEIDSIYLPRMILQPLVENAIIHGIAPKRTGFLQIKFQIIEDNVIIQIIDNGIGMEPHELLDLNYHIDNCEQLEFHEMGIEHIAIPNIQKRIVGSFGKEYGLTVNSEPNNGTTITMRLPLLLQ